MRAGFALALLAGAALGQQVTPVQVPAGARLRDAVYADVNGDGRNDLVLSTSRPTRALQIHLQRKGKVSFAGQPDHTLERLWKDVVAFAVADVHKDPGAEVVLFTARAVWAWRPRAGERERAHKLAECAFLWQIPDPSGAVSWQAGVRDLDGDKRPDLVIPEADGYRLLFGGRFDQPQLLVVPSGPEGSAVGALSFKARTRRLRTRLEIRFSMSAPESEAELSARGPLLQVTDTVPAPLFLDWDGDGDLDLMVRTEKWMLVWTQTKRRFPQRPDVSLEMPVVEERGRTLDVSYSTHVADLDKDLRADCVIFSGDQRSRDVRTQVQFFRQAKRRSLFGKQGLPDQLLVLAGFAGQPRLDDVDGDGYPDLLVGAVRPDLLDALGGSSEQIDAELYLFRNRRGVFSRRPDLVFRTSVEAKGLRLRTHSVMARFFGDATGDGVRDLLLREERTRLRVLMTRRTRTGLAIHPAPLWETRIHEDATVRLGPSRGRRKAPDLLILEPTQLLFVRFP